MAERLKLCARDGEDLQALAAILQDALVPMCDMAYVPAERRFVIVANRFCWECCAAAAEGPAPAGRDGDPQDGPLFERVHTGLCFDRVLRVRRRGIHPRESGHILSLLTMTMEDDRIYLLFAGGGAIELTVECLRCRMEDLDEPWPTRWRPCHPADGADHAA
ncbi:MAG: DUF2948 family protein [Rhodospirillaceae bacterium]|nr:DUF2948 family protein [Rhodospirillaceae bacterium]